MSLSGNHVISAPIRLDSVLEIGLVHNRERPVFHSLARLSKLHAHLAAIHALNLKLSLKCLDLKEILSAQLRLRLDKIVLVVAKNFTRQRNENIERLTLDRIHLDDIRIVSKDHTALNRDNRTGLVLRGDISGLLRSDRSRSFFLRRLNNKVALLFASTIVEVLSDDTVSSLNVNHVCIILRRVPGVNNLSITASRLHSGSLNSGQSSDIVISDTATNTRITHLFNCLVLARTHR